MVDTAGTTEVTALRIVLVIVPAHAIVRVIELEVVWPLP
jgi:hypothetical protein